MRVPQASIVVPAFNAAATIEETLNALLVQTHRSFEVVVVDDGSTDRTADIVASISDHRIRLIRQANRGLSGARNTGLAAARGPYVGFCDADDLWLPEKLECHVDHLVQNPRIGISYSASRLIDELGRPLRVAQMPKLRNVTARDVFLRNPIGNGSAAVVRREAFDAIAFVRSDEPGRTCWFDEDFRQSEDIEAWLRFALTTDWDIEGIGRELTLYRVTGRGLSGDVDRQLASWRMMCAKAADLNPRFVKRHRAAAEAYQLRYLGRRAISAHDARAAARLSRASLRRSLAPLFQEPVKTVATIAAAELLALAGPTAFARVTRRLMVPAAAAPLSTS